MNILIIFTVAAGALAALWVVQSIALLIAGEPLALPLRFTTRRPLVKWTSRVMTHVAWLIILIGSPLALGTRPQDALAQAFPLPVPWREIAAGFSVVFFPISLAYVLLAKIGWIRFEPQHDRATRRAKLFRRFLGPLPVAFLEEAVFRGILLEQMLQVLPQTRFYAVSAVIMSSVAFSLVHFIKRQPDKPFWQPAYGFFIVGCLLGLCYLLGGRTLWLAIIVHATLVFTIEVAKLYTMRVAPRWLMGYPEWPQAGVVGSAFLLFVAIVLLLLI
jgi:hypothetical protein